MITIRTSSRLHFGLLSLAPEGSAWETRSGGAVLLARSFGGVGLMVEQPGMELTLAAADSWSVSCTQAGSLAERALALARHFAAAVHGSTPCAIEIRKAVPEHVGLGTGTQLALAIGRGLARLWGLDHDLATLTRLTGRGRRSGLGAHGFARGGFLVETGKRPSDILAPLAIRLDFPEAWSILLVMPHDRQGLHGSPERQAFESMGHAQAQVALGSAGRSSLRSANTDALCRLVLLGMVPALLALDADTFGEALYDFNQRAGEPFAVVQGGIYSSSWTVRWVDWLRGQGVKGVGQSSWGPTVFAVIGDPERAAWLARRLAEEKGGSADQVITTRACNQGATTLEQAN